MQPQGLGLRQRCQAGAIHVAPGAGVAHCIPVTGGSDRGVLGHGCRTHFQLFSTNPSKKLAGRGLLTHGARQSQPESGKCVGWEDSEEARSVGGRQDILTATHSGAT